MQEQIQNLMRKLSRRQHAYEKTFGSSEGKIVLADLAKFCRAGQTPFHEDPRVTALLQGRQEVFLRIQQHVNLPFNDLYNLLGGPKDE